MPLTPRQEAQAFRYVLRPPETLRERLDALVRQLGEPVRPALYPLLPPVGSGTAWQSAAFRLARGVGPFIIAGIVDRYLTSHIDGPLGGLLSLQLGGRRALHEVDAYAVCSSGRAPGSVPFAEAYRRVDWEVPLVVGTGEMIQLEVRPDKKYPGSVATQQAKAAYVLAGFHTTEKAAEWLRDRGQLWAHTLTVKSTETQAEASDEYIAARDTVLDAITTAGSFGSGGDNGLPANNEIERVARLTIDVGEHRLTPLPLTSTALGRDAETSFVGSLQGLTLRRGEVVRVSQTALAATATTQRYTLLGRQ
jgi:hypothetical protein